MGFHASHHAAQTGRSLFQFFRFGSVWLFPCLVGNSIAFFRDVHINCDMVQKFFRIPSTTALIALESVARLGGVGRAAEELNTSQSAISRHLKQLEADLGVKLLEKSGRGIVLTPAGATYSQSVTAALQSLNTAGQALRTTARDVTIACTHEVSHLLIMPEFGRLRQALGKTAGIRILTCEYDAAPAMVHAGADIIFEYSETPPGRASVAILNEMIVPVATPSFVDKHRRALLQAPSEWKSVPRLSLTKDNFGWATWANWFEARGSTPPSDAVETFDNYVYLLEAAATGAGLALGWKGFVDRYLSSGALVVAAGPWVPRPSRLYARLTKKGERNPNSTKCLSLLATIVPSNPLSPAQSGPAT